MSEEEVKNHFAREPVGPKTIDLPSFGITISISESGSGSISSELTDGVAGKKKAAFDALEAIILSHACNGVDVKDSDYLSGLEEAFNAIERNIGE